MYGKKLITINKYQIIPYPNQMLNAPNNNIGKYPLDNRSRKINVGANISNQINFSNGKRLKEINNNRVINNMVITKDGKRYVLSKNVQRIREEVDPMKTYN